MADITNMKIDYKILAEALDIKRGTAQVRLFRLCKTMDVQLGPVTDALNKALASTKGQGSGDMDATPSLVAKKAQTEKDMDDAKDGSPISGNDKKRKLADLEEPVSVVEHHWLIHTLIDVWLEF